MRLAPHPRELAALLLYVAALIGTAACSGDDPKPSIAPDATVISIDNARPVVAAFAAMGLGLLISASVTNANRAQSLIPIALIHK